MSNDGRPEFKALAELERVLMHAQNELASFRRRAHKAESDRAEMGVGQDIVASREKIAELERDQTESSERLGAARDRVDGLLARLRFLEEQVETEERSQ